MTKEVFISYASEDEEVANKVCAHLELNGVSCWFAPRDLAGVIDYTEAIPVAIDSSQLMVLLVSSHSNASRHVRREINLVMEHHDNILPVRIEQISDAFRYVLTTGQRFDAFEGPIENHLERLTEDVKLFLQQAVITTGAVDIDSAPKVPSLTKLSEREEIVEAWQQLEKALTWNSFSVRAMVGTGGPGAKWKSVRWRPQERIWLLCSTRDGNAYLWCGTQNPQKFKRLTVECEIVLPLNGINSPELFNDGALFLRDENEKLLLAHTGEISVESGVSKDFVSSHLGSWHLMPGANDHETKLSQTADDEAKTDAHGMRQVLAARALLPGRAALRLARESAKTALEVVQRHGAHDNDFDPESQVLTIGALDDSEFPAHLATFVRAVATFFRDREIGPRGELQPGAIKDYSLDELMQVLWQSLGADWYGLEDAIKLAALALGFKQVGFMLDMKFQNAIESELPKMFEVSGKYENIRIRKIS